MVKRKRRSEVIDIIRNNISARESLLKITFDENVKAEFREELVSLTAELESLTNAGLHNLERGVKQSEIQKEIQEHMLAVASLIEQLTSSEDVKADLRVTLESFNAKLHKLKPRCKKQRNICLDTENTSPVCSDRGYESGDKTEQTELLIKMKVRFEKDEFECQLSNSSPFPPECTDNSYVTLVSIADNLKKTNELLNQEVLLLRGQCDSLKLRCEHLELELQKSTKKAEEAMKIAAEEAAKTRDFISSKTAQITEIVERLNSSS